MVFKTVETITNDFSFFYTTSSRPDDD